MKKTPKNSTPPAASPEVDQGPVYLEPHEMIAEPGIQNAAALEPWGVFGDLDISHLSRQLVTSTRKVTKDGDLQGAEAMLYGQALALQTIFTNLSRRAAKNAGEYMGAADTYLRLALKAQAQCRATLETLAAIKNPPVVFARQANIAHGPQQVNNGHGPQKTEQYAPASARPGETASTPTELLEDRTHGRTQLDPGAAPAASAAHPQLVPVGTLDRPPHR